MTHPIHHAESTVRRFGGKVDDYLPLHQWLVLIWKSVKGKKAARVAHVRATNAVIRPRTVNTCDD